ncbi:piwi domain-containing protein [Aphelenchoides avenae]|nr:piwi domain-containing protein [Aphelenchus avenae]
MWKRLSPEVEEAAKICNLHRVFVTDQYRRRIYIDEEADFGQVLDNTSFEVPKDIALWKVLYADSDDSAEVNKFTEAFSKWADSKGMTIQQIEAELTSGTVEGVCRQLAGKEGDVVTLISDSDELKLKLMRQCGLHNVGYHALEREGMRRALRDPAVLHESVYNVLSALSGLNYAPMLEGIRPEFRLVDVLVVSYKVAEIHSSDKEQSDVIVGYASNNNDNGYMFMSGSFFARDVNAQLKDLMRRVLQQMHDAAPNSALPPRILLVRCIGQRGQDKHVQSELEAFRAGCEELGYRPQIAQILVFKQGVVFSKDFMKRINVGHGVEFRRKTHLNNADRMEFAVYAHYTKPEDNTSLTLYQVAHDEIGISAIEGMSLMRQLCYCHQNLTQPISLPDPSARRKGLFERKNDGTDVERLNAELELH